MVTEALLAREAGGRGQARFSGAVTERHPPREGSRVSRGRGLPPLPQVSASSSRFRRVAPGPRESRGPLRPDPARPAVRPRRSAAPGWPPPTPPTRRAQETESALAPSDSDSVATLGHTLLSRPLRR